MANMREIQQLPPTQIKPKATQFTVNKDVCFLTNIVEKINCQNNRKPLFPNKCSNNMKQCGYVSKDD